MSKTKEAENKLYSDDSLAVSIHKCPNCGGESVFEPKSQKLKCLYCGSLFAINNHSLATERELDELLNEGQVWKEAEVYQCKTCGAKEIISIQDMSHKCSFCGTSNIVKSEELPGIEPQGITPFKIDKMGASVNAVKWAKKKLYAPRAFKKSVKADNIQGIYNPVFTFDASTVSSYNGKLGKNFTRHIYRDGKMTSVIETRYFNIAGSQDAYFDDLLVQASSTVPSEFIKQIEPFPTKEAVQYRTEYLRGYGASTYNKTGKQCWEECKSVMHDRIENQILKRYDYDIKVSLSIDTKYFNEQYKYILVPVYVGHYNFKGKLYNFYVNGYNGRVGGKTPVSKLKIFFTVLSVLLAIAGVLLIVKFV